MSLRVMTYNILDGGRKRETHILEVIQTARPDVVIPQEVFTEELLMFLSRSLGMTYYTDIGNKRRKVTLLSRLPVHTFRSYHPVFPIWRNFIEAEIEYEPGRKADVSVYIRLPIWKSFLKSGAHGRQNILPGTFRVFETGPVS